MLQHLCIPKIFFTESSEWHIKCKKVIVLEIVLKITPNDVLFVVVLCCFIILVCGKGVI